MENLNPQNDLNTPLFDPSLNLDFEASSSHANESIKSKTSLRMNYEAQVEVIKKQIGDLEKIRENLGLSARKMCQLLLVDPSAWTRWTKKGDVPPPHIYRSLQWYLTLQEKVPGLTPTYFLGGTRAPQAEEWNRRFEEQRMIFETQRAIDHKEHLFELERLNRKMTRLYGLALLSWGILAILLYTLH